MAAVYLLLRIIGCSESPYELFCEDLDGGNFKQCLSDAEFRERYLSQQVEDRVRLSVRILQRFPASLMSQTVTDDIRRNAARLDSLTDLPVEWPNLEVTAESHPKLVGRYYVARIEWDRSDGLIMLETDRLTKAQVEFLNGVCRGMRDVCIGEYYIQLLPSHLFGLLPYLVGADIEPITEAKFRSAHETQMRRYLEHVEASATYP